MEQRPNIPEYDGPKEPNLTTGEYPYLPLQNVNSEPFLTYDIFTNQARSVPNQSFSNMMFNVQGNILKGSFSGKTQDFLYVKSMNLPRYPGLDENPPKKAPERGIKFHISVDPDRINEAWDIVLDVMAQYGVPMGKVDNPFNNRHPEEGREITIYAFKDYGRRFLDSDLQTDDRASWEEIISQITTLLAERRIQPGVAAEGNSGGGGPETRISNNNYVTWRNDDEELFKLVEGVSRNQKFYTNEDIEKIQRHLEQEQITMTNMNIQCPYAQQERLSLEEHILRRKTQHSIRQSTTPWEIHKPLSNNNSEILDQREEISEKKKNKIVISTSRQKKEITTDQPPMNNSDILDDTSTSSQKTEQIWQKTKHKYTDKPRTQIFTIRSERNRNIDSQSIEREPLNNNTQSSGVEATTPQTVNNLGNTGGSTTERNNDVDGNTQARTTQPMTITERAMQNRANNTNDSEQNPTISNLKNNS